ncbi:MAG: MFS transporter [Candidatus Heimdallarchaeota archaeon]|nr:MFS transporter [Candidatus Heimdallarchaeota archaeon]
MVLPDKSDYKSTAIQDEILAEEIENVEEAGDKPSLKSVLNNKSFLLVFFAHLMENLGGYAVYIILIYLIFTTSGESKFLIGIFQIVTIVPNVILAPISGLMVDRFDQRKIMMISIIVRILTAIFLAIIYILRNYIYIITYAQDTLSDGHTIIYRIINPIHFLWLVIALFIIRVSIWPFFLPSKNAYLKLIIRKKDLLVANSFYSTVIQISGVIGPLVAGLLVSVNYLIGFYFTIGMTLISVVLFIALVFAGKKPPKQQEEKITSVKEGWGRTIREIKDGFDTFKVIKKVSYAIIIAAIVSFAFAGLDIMWPIILQGEMNLSPRWYGAMDSIVSFCGIISSLVLLKIGKINRKVVLLTVVFILEGISMGLMGYIRNPWIMIFFVMLPFGISFGLNDTVYQTLIQEQVPYKKQGKIQSVDWFLSSITIILGLIIVTAISELIVSSYILYICGGLALLIAFGGLLYIRWKKLYISDYQKKSKMDKVTSS